MSKYRNKPVVIEAYRFTGSSTSSWKIKEWMDGGLCPEPGGMQTADMCNCEIETLEGTAGRLDRPRGPRRVLPSSGRYL